MIQQICNTATEGGATIQDFDLSAYNGNVYSAAAVGTAGQTVVISASQDKTNWQALTTLTVGTKNTDVWQAAWRFMRVDRTGGANVAVSVG